MEKAAEFRNAFIKMLKKSSTSTYRYDKFGIEFIRALERENTGHGRYTNEVLDYEEREVLRDVFWQLFREGIITVFVNDANPDTQYFRLSLSAQENMDHDHFSMFYDVDDYISIIKNQVPDIDPVACVYLSEAMKAYRSGCMLSSSVMLGVATEHLFELMLETILNNHNHGSRFASIKKDGTIHKKLIAFKGIMDQLIIQGGKEMDGVKHNFDIDFLAILNIIRTFRNESGHPSGKIIDKPQAFALLHLFPAYSKKIYQIIDYFSREHDGGTAK